LWPISVLFQPLPLSDYRSKESVSHAGGFVDSHGALIYYKWLGRGTPLMVVHGGPGASHDYLLPHLLPLMRTNKIIFIDERGSGRSSKIEDAKQYTVANMVEDIESVRQALGLARSAF